MQKARFLVAAFLLVMLSMTITAIRNGGSVDAAQLSPRFIKLSSSTPSATGVTYSVSFTTSGSFQSLIIDFCADSPLVGFATCTNPTGMSVAAPTVNFTSGTIGTVSTTGSTAFQLKVSGTVSQAAGAIAFTVAGVTNQTAASTFYARIYTYSNATFGTPTAYTSFANPGSTVDTGSVALSTANAVAISATVQETLTFCTSGLVTGSAPTTCGSTTPPTVILGTGTPPTITSASVFDNTAGTYRTYMILSTNASSGAAVSMKSGYSCNGLSKNSGTSCEIAGNTTATPIAAGSGKFGLYVAPGSGGTGAITGIGNYATSGLYYSGANVASTSTYGDPIAQSGAGPSPCLNVVSQLAFAASATATQPAGAYQANLEMIATGTF